MRALRPIGGWGVSLLLAGLLGGLTAGMGPADRCDASVAVRTVESLAQDEGRKKPPPPPKPDGLHFLL